MVDVKAKLKYARIAPRKMRLLADLIRGLPLSEAKTRVGFSIKKSAKPFLKLLKSAESNAKHNYKLDSEGLFVKEVKVDDGPILKRYKPRMGGRATTIRRRTSHVSVSLSEKQKSVKRKTRNEK